MITTCDYNTIEVTSEQIEDLKHIANTELSNISLDDHPHLLVFPDSFERYERDFARKMICSIDSESKRLQTNSIVGFVGYNETYLAIHSRFAKTSTEDYFLHYMLQRVAKINLLELKHTSNEESVFDFLIYLFPYYLKKALQQGLFKRYVSRKYNDANIKGVIDINRHIRHNYPFNGRIAYSTREYSCDNEVTQLIRHTIEHIVSINPNILSSDYETREAVSQIRSITQTYLRQARQEVIHKNLRPVIHPYYSEYTSLQRLCLQILRHEELKFGHDKDKIYGVLIDAAWLWEEYLAIVIQEHYNHYLKERGKIFSLFNNIHQQIIPDYISKDMSIVADAKYIPLNKQAEYGEEKTTAVYYKTITYMYRFCTDIAYLLYPIPSNNQDPKEKNLYITSEREGVNGGRIIKEGLRIPQECNSFDEFTNAMQQSEDKFIKSITPNF